VALAPQLPANTQVPQVLDAAVGVPGVVSVPWLQPTANVVQAFTSEKLPATMSRLKQKKRTLRDIPSEGANLFDHMRASAVQQESNVRVNVEVFFIVRAFNNKLKYI
jgi:hypothetical protein